MKFSAINLINLLSWAVWDLLETSAKMERTLPHTALFFFSLLLLYFLIYPVKTIKKQVQTRQHDEDLPSVQAGLHTMG